MTETRVYIERWEQMLRVLRGLDAHQRKEHWNMSIWAEDTPCGTVACAAGHCAMDPWFNEQGLTLRTLGHADDVFVLSRSAGSFWDEYGAEKILYAGHQRPVETVIKEIERHIEWLREEQLEQ